MSISISLTGNLCPHIIRGNEGQPMSHWKSVFTYNKVNCSNNGYQCHWKQGPYIYRATKESTDISLIGNQWPDITSATTGSTALNPTGNQCQQITRTTTAAGDISLTENQCPHITKKPEPQMLSVSLEFSVYI